MNRPNDEQDPASTPEPNASRVRRGRAFQIAALGLIAISALAGTKLAYLLKSPNPQSKLVEDKRKIPARLFRDWGAPDFVLVLSAQQEGYLMPCGCSDPQSGGLERRYNFIELLKKEKGWRVVAVDLGDVPQKHSPVPHLANVQGLIKYRYSMMALKEMGYLAVGIGENEAGGSWSLEKIEGEWAANAPQPALLAANLKDMENKFPFLKTGETQTVSGTNIKIGVTSIVGYSVANSLRNRSIQFDVPTTPSIQAQLTKMQEQKVDLPILLYHGYPTGKQEALFCARKFPDFPIILALSEEDEPPVGPDAVDHPDKDGIRNYVFRLGHKGKYIGVLGVYRNGPNFHFKYQLVKLDPEYKTLEGREDAQPIMKLMENYTRELKRENYLQKYIQTSHPMQAMDPVKGLRKPGDGTPHYVGSDACLSCHKHAYDVWSDSPHSHAYEALVKAKHPSMRQYDGECIVCHTVGFGYKTGFANEKDTPDLINVGCESCHGPGSLHADNPKNTEWQERMSQPWLPARKKGDVKAKNAAIERFCVTCHDIDNDVTWAPNKANNNNPFHAKWVGKNIIHNNPPKKE